MKQGKSSKHPILNKYSSQKQFKDQDSNIAVVYNRVKRDQQNFQPSSNLTEQQKKQIRQQIIQRKKRLEEANMKLNQKQKQMMKEDKQLQQKSSQIKNKIEIFCKLHQVRSQTALDNNQHYIEDNMPQSRRNLSKQKQVQSINQFWNGSERSQSKLRNEWQIMDSYAQQNFSQPVSIYQTPIRSDDNSIVGYEIEDRSQYLFDNKIMQIGKKKQANKNKLNDLYFQSQIKDIIFQENQDKGSGKEPKEISAFNKKKNQNELVMNNLIYSSSIKNIIGESITNDGANIIAPQQYKSYQTRGVEQKVKGKRSMNFGSVGQQFQSNWEIKYDESPQNL